MGQVIRQGAWLSTCRNKYGAEVANLDVDVRIEERLPSFRSQWMGVRWVKGKVEKTPILRVLEWRQLRLATAFLSGAFDGLALAPPASVVLALPLPLPTPMPALALRIDKSTSL